MPRRTILVVEDDAQRRGMFRQALWFAGFSVDEAGDGTSALQRIEDRPPDLVVLDLQLPTLAGWAVLDEITAHARTGHPRK